MGQTEVIAIGKEAIYTMLLVSAPALAVSLVLGLIISIFQATTQINEQTLTFVPKIVAIFVVLIVTGPWMMNVMLGFTIRLFNQINTLTP